MCEYAEFEKEYAELEEELKKTANVFQHGFAGYVAYLLDGIEPETRRKHMLRTAELVRMAGGNETDIVSARYHDVRHGNLSHMLDKIVYYLGMAATPFDSYHERQEICASVPRSGVVKGEGANADRVDYIGADGVRYGYATQEFVDALRRAARVEDGRLVIPEKYADELSRISLDLDRHVYNDPKRQHMEMVAAAYYAKRIQAGELSFEGLLRKEYSDLELAKAAMEVPEIRAAVEADAVWVPDPAGVQRRCRALVLNGTRPETVRAIDEWRRECAVPVSLRAN